MSYLASLIMFLRQHENTTFMPKIKQAVHATRASWDTWRSGKKQGLLIITDQTKFRNLIIVTKSRVHLKKKNPWFSIFILSFLPVWRFDNAGSFKTTVKTHLCHHLWNWAKRGSSPERVSHNMEGKTWGLDKMVVIRGRSLDQVDQCAWKANRVLAERIKVIFYS